MSFYDLSKLSDEEMVAQFILESRKAGPSLAYVDYQIIDSWLEKAQGDVDLVLLVLSENLPAYLESPRNKKGIFSLRGIAQKIDLRLENAKKKLS